MTLLVMEQFYCLGPKLNWQYELMVFGPILLINSVQYSLVKYQSIELPEIPSHRSWLKFSYLSKLLFFARFDIVHHFADVNILLLSFLHHTWCNPDQDICHFAMHIDFLIIWCLLGTFCLNCSFISKGKFSPLITSHRSSQTTAHDIVHTHHFDCHWNFHFLTWDNGSKHRLLDLTCLICT